MGQPKWAGGFLMRLVTKSWESDPPVKEDSPPKTLALPEGHLSCVPGVRGLEMKVMRDF